MKRFLTIFVTALLGCFVATSLWAAPPTTQAKYLGFSNITSSGAKASWINGNGAGRVVVISTDNTFDTPVSTDNYSAADGSLSNAVTITGGSDKVIGFTTGTTRTITLSGLSSNTTYYIRIYEYNGSHGSYQFSTATGVNNPRSFTTLAGLSAPTNLTVTTDTPAQNTNTFPFSFTGVSGATGYEFTIDDNNDFSSPLNEYNQVDLGNLTSWEAYLPIATTYHIRVRAYNNSEYSPWASTSFSVNTSMPPKFLDGDTLSLTEQGSPNYGNFNITINFDQPVYSANNGTGALTTSSFAAYAPSAGTDAHSKVVITAVSHTAGASTATITVRFNARVTTSEKFRIGPANATSIYSVNGLIPSANGVPMDVSLNATKGGQYSADITCPELSVLNTTDNIAFGTIQKAIDAGTTAAGETIQLKDNTTYNENVTVNKAVTITDQGVTDAISTGKWTLGGTSDVDLSTGTISITGLTFQPNNDASILVSNVYNGTVSIQGNTFSIDAAADIGISVQSNRSSGALTNLNIGNTTANTFNGAVAGARAIYFNDDGTGSNGITNVAIQQNTFPTTTTSIAFENVDLIGFLPPINLGAGNTNIDGMTITSKYVYSHATLDASTYLYPGIAVLGLSDASTLQGGTAQEYFTVAAAIAASANDGTESVFLGSGTYTEAIALNEAVSLVGKGNTSSGTVLTNTVTASATAAAHTISNLYFDVQNTNGIDISSSGNLTVSNNTFALGSSEIGVNVSATAFTNALNISSNTFNLNDATAKGINIPNTSIQNTSTINSNTFSGSAAGTGIYISTTNSTGASTGTLNITGNTFNNTVGDAIVFEDAVNSANSLSGATINIYYGNNFNQTGYGIKINDVATYNGFIGSTLPATIDLYSTSANTNFTAADIYGAAWYDLTGTSAVLYPSIQAAENADLASTLNIGAGTYAEDVTFSGGTNLTTITGNGTTCELASTNRVTLEKNYAFSGFSATLITVGDDDGNTTEGNIDDAMDIIKTDGNISIAADAVIGGGTVDKKVTITDAGTGGAIDGTLLVTVSGGDITNLDLTGNPAITINLTNGCSASTVISGNAFTLANGGDGILVQTGNANSAGTFPLNIVGNTFTGGDATSKAINFRNQTTGFATFSGVNVYDGNTFNTPGYNFYKTQEGNICTYLPSVDVKNTTNNTYTTTNISGFYLNPAATTISTATETIITDCIAPAAFTTGSVTTTTNAVAGWWNSDNSAINVQVPIANDASLAYGNVQIIASRDNWTTTLNLGSANQIAPGDLGTTKTYSFNAATFEGLTGFTENDVWRFNATITDFAGNQTTGTQSSTTITVDQTAPTVTLNSATADNIINITEKAAGFNVNAQSNENNTTLYVVNTTDNTPTYSTISTVGFASANAPTAGNAVNIAVSANNANIVDGKTYKVFGMDQAGNLSAASATSFTVDLTAPAAFTVGNVIVVSGNKPGYYNANDNTNNRAVQVTVPVANDASLVGGTIQVQVKRNVGGTFANIGTPHTITNPNLGNNVDITITKAQLQAISGLTEGDVLYWTAVITDLANNSTTGTQSNSTITYDITPPAATTIASRTAVTAPVVANYFNASNTAVDVVVNIPNDATLVGGNYKVQARTNANAFADVAVTTNAIAIGDLGSTKTIQVAKTGTANTDLDELTGWASGVTLDFRAVLEDAAGNSTDGTAFGTSMNVDLVAPAAFTTGSVTTVTNAVAGWWNADNTQLDVVVPVDNDASLMNGTIKLYASDDNFSTEQQLGSTYTIAAINTNYTFNIPAATFEALTGFGEGDVWKFRAVITDIAGNVTTGTKSATSITVDQVAPTATLVSATADNVINIQEKASGFNVVAQSNEATGTLYVVNVTTNPTSTYANIGTHGFATSAVNQANTNINVAVSANNTNIITGSTYKVYAIDAAGNLSTPSTALFTTDLVAPTITSITSTTANGLYGIGSQINFTFNLDENAIFTANGGDISLPMALDQGTGNAIRSTDAASSNSLSLTYTVANGQAAADLTHGAGPAVLNGGATWTDAAGNPVVLTLPNPNTFQTAKAIVIDGIPPTFTVAYHLNSVTGPALGVNPTIGIGTNYYIKITASEELASNPTISIGGLAAGPPTNNVTNANTFTHIANTVFSYNRHVVESNDNGADELITITGTDLAGNTATNAVPTNAFNAVPANTGNQAKVDGKRPTPVITLAAPVDYNDGTNDWTNNNPIAVSINYGETVQNVTNSVVSVTNGTKSNFVNNANTIFTLDVTPSSNGTVTVSVPEGDGTNQIKDAGGNYAYGATKSINYDNIAPTTTDNVPAVWQTSNVTITFSPNDGTGSGVKRVYYTSDGNDPDQNSSYVDAPMSYQIMFTADGQYTIKYRAEDNVGNLEAVKTAANLLKIDQTNPVIQANTIIVPTNGTIWNGGNQNITWTAANITDATSGLTATPISLYYTTNASNPNPTWILIASGLANNGSYTWNVPNSINSSDVKVRIDAVDVAGNVASQPSHTFTIDNTPPTATITITPNNTPSGGYSINNATTSVTIDADFNENMDQTFTPTLTLNTELDNILNDEAPTTAAWQSATKYRWVLAVNGTGLTKLDNTIDVTGAKDLAQNTMTPAQLTGVKVDQVLPTLPHVAILSNNAVTPGNGTNAGFAKVSNNVTLNITATESLQTLTGTIAGTAGTPSGSGTSWSLARAMTGSDAEGLVAFTIDFTDLAGNAGTTVTAVAGSGAGSSITFDKTPPVVVINNPTLNQCVNGTQQLNFTVTEANPNNPSQAKFGAGSYTDVSSPALINTLNGWSGASEGTNQIAVQHTDKAGNVGSATVNVNKDTQAPTILSITLGTVTLGDDLTKTTTDDVVTFTVTFSEPVYSFDAGDITLYKPGTGNTVNNPDIVITGGNTVYTVTLGGVTPITGDGPLGITVITSDIVDCANNALSAPMTTGTFTIDNTPPTVYNVVNNCDNSPLNGYTYNQAAQITFSEGVYTNNNATGALVGGDLNVTASSGNATLQSWGVISGSHTAGGTTINITTNWNGTVLGSEKLRADAATAASIYDKAGNAMAVAGSDQGGPAAPKNWDYAKSQIVILTQPTNTSTCETGTAQFTTSAQGGLSVAYQWQYYNGSSWVDLSNATINGATFSNVTTSQMTVTNPNSTNWNGKQFRCNVTNDCGSLATNAATLTVNPNTYISTQPSNTQACYGSVNNNLTVTAGGQPPVGYQWQYSADGVNGWANVANGTPTNATYTGGTLATLNIQGNIAAGTYYYRVIVSSQCGPNVTSDVATLTVNPLPNASLTIGGAGTICQGSSTNITVALSENGVNYQLRNNADNSNVGSVVAGNGGTINLPTGNLNSTTTFNVLATNATSGCSVQLSTTATVTVEATPVNPTLASKTPNQDTVCQGSTVSATFNAGSGGTTDEYRYSLDNGGTWTTYTPGDNLTAGTQTILIQGRRNAAVCTPGSWTTLASWTVELTPVAASLTKDPNTTAVCYGTSVRATWSNHGSGGNGTYSYEYRTSSDNGTTWTNWTTYSYTQDGDYIGSDISTTGLTNVEIRATRNATYCSSATNTVSWTVNPLPTASISGTTPACQSTLLTATTNASNPTYQWKKDGNNVGTNSSTYTATASGNYTVVVTDGVTGCSYESAQYAVQIYAQPTVYTVSGGPFCAGSNINITLSGSQNGYTYNLKKDGTTISTQTGDGNSLTFNVNSANAGTYTIEAVNGTCTQAMSGSVTVNPAPTANAGADAYTCGTTAYTVSGASATNYSSVSWTVTNGGGTLTNANTLTPTYTPAAGDVENTVTLTLTVTALSGCSNVQDQMQLTVTPYATANAGSDASICEGSTFTVSTASASNYTSLQWTHNGTGTISNGTTLTPTYTPGVGETGTVTLTLTANGVNGCNATDAMVLTINQNPSITTNATNQTRCGTGNVTFTAATTSPNSVIDWSSTNTFASYTTGNSYTVSVTAGNTDTYYYRARNTGTGCVSGTQSVTGTAYELPTPTISGANTVALNTDLSLTSTNTYSSYNWSATGSPTITNGTSQTATFNWSAAGNYVVTLNVTDANGCSNSTTHNVTVTATQAPVITGNPSNATKCSNETSATFSVTSVSGVPTPTLQWQVSTDGGNSWNAVSGGDYSGGNTTELTVTNLSGKNGYQYRLYATNGVNPDDYSDAATLTVTSAQTPSVTISSSDNDNTFCSGTSVTFTATPTNLGGGTVAYQWKLNGGNVGSNQNTYTTTTLVNNDQVSCVITITGGCVTTTTATSNTITNTVLQNTQISQHPQSATVNEGDNHTFTVTASGDNLTYTWYKSPSTVVGTGSSYTINNVQASDAGTYYVVVSGTCGNVQSNNATLTVQQPAVKLAIDNIGTQTDGTAFTITVRSLNSSNVATNVTENTEFSITVETGTGTIGTVTGTITTGTSSTTVNVTYNKTGGETGVSLKATRTSGMNLTAGTSNTFTVLAAEPTTQASYIQFLEVGANYVKIKWTNGSGSNRLVLCEQGNASVLTEVPTDGTGYTANTTFGSGTQIGGSYVVAITDKDTVTIFGLTYNQTYAFKVVEFNGSGSSANYKTNGFLVGTSNPKQRKIDGKESVNESSTIALGEHFILTGINPNPATSDINFTVVTKEAMDANIEIVNELGVVVHSFSKSLTVGEHPFNLKLGSEKGGLPSGTYLLRVTAGGESLIQKFIYMP